MGLLAETPAASFLTLVFSLHAGAASPEYIVSADDCNAIVAIECVPMDDQGRRVRLHCHLQSHPLLAPSCCVCQLRRASSAWGGECHYLVSCPSSCSLSLCRESWSAALPMMAITSSQVGERSVAGVSVHTVHRLCSGITEQCGTTAQPVVVTLAIPWPAMCLLCSFVPGLRRCWGARPDHHMGQRWHCAIGDHSHRMWRASFLALCLPPYAATHVCLSACSPFLSGGSVVVWVAGGEP